MKLSIIVPVYNAEKYIRECLDSLVNQTIDDYELILVNDGSKDSSLSILSDYQARYPELIRILDIDNGGQGRARNLALNIVKGDYVGFVDSDDYVSKEMFKKMLSLAEKENADITVCDAYRFTETKKAYMPARLLNDSFVLSSAGAVWNKIFKRELISDCRFPERLWYEDLAFSAILLLKSTKTVFIEEPLYYYRCGQQSTMNNSNSRKNLDILTVVDLIRPYIHDRETLDYLVLNHILLDSINRVASQRTKESKDVAKKLCAYVKDSVPDLMSSSTFMKEPLKRRIIMWLNFYGLDTVSQFLLSIKH